MTVHPSPIRVPEPALVRGTLVAITAVAAVILGHSIDVTWIELVVNAYAGLAPLFVAWLIRRKVTPVEVAEARVEEALYTEVPSVPVSGPAEDQSDLVVYSDKEEYTRPGYSDLEKD